MDASFTGAATPLPNQQKLVFTSDWQKTLGDVNWNNFALLEFLSDAKKAGHRVIICSTLAMHKIHDTFDLFIMMGRAQGYDVLDREDFELISKADLKNMNVTPDYSFDDESIDRQYINGYVNPKMEITVFRDFKMSPMPMEQLRALCCLQRNKNENEPAGPVLVPR